MVDGARRVRRLEWNDEKGGYYVVGGLRISTPRARAIAYGELQMDRMPGVTSAHTTDEEAGRPPRFLRFPASAGILHAGASWAPKASEV
jgi:hypothetical protein